MLYNVYNSRPVANRRSNSSCAALQSTQNIQIISIPSSPFALPVAMIAFVRFTVAAVCLTGGLSGLNTRRVAVNADCAVLIS